MHSLKGPNPFLVLAATLILYSLRLSIPVTVALLVQVTISVVCRVPFSKVRLMTILYPVNLPLSSEGGFHDIFMVLGMVPSITATSIGGEDGAERCQ